MSAAANLAEAPADTAEYRVRRRACLAANLPAHGCSDVVDHRLPSLEEAESMEAGLHRQGLWGIA